MANLAKLYPKVALKLRHGQFELRYSQTGEMEIVGTGSYKDRSLGTISLKWPYRVKRERNK